MMADLFLFWTFGWVPLCILVAVMSLFIAALAHMLGTAFGIPNLVLYAKSEYMQVLATVLIILAALSMVFVGGRISGSIAAQLAAASGNTDFGAIPPGAQADPFTLARAYILQVPVDCMKTIYWAVYYKNIWTELWSSVSFNVGNVEGVSGGFFTAGVVSLAHFAAQNITYLALFQYVQYSLLRFSQYTLLQIFLPIGLVLRAFPITRGVGGLMTAFALGFAFVYPITYVLIVAMMPSNQFACTQVSTNTDFSRQMFGAKFLEDDPCFNNAGAQTMMGYKVSSDSQRDSGMASLVHAVNQLYLQAVFYPLVSLIITFTFVRQTGSLFGADLAEIGRGLIKLI